MPHLARKKTKVAARKSASDLPRRVQSSALTRKLKRTREEKSRQNSDDDSSNLRRFSPSLPPPSGRGIDKPVNKAFNSSARRNPAASQPMLVAKQNPAGKLSKCVSSIVTLMVDSEIIDITSDGESGPPKAKLGKNKNHVPRDVLEISSEDDNESKESPSSNARGPSNGQSISRTVIEILDSDDEPLSASAILGEMRVDEVTADMLAQRTMDVMDRLSLRESQSPHDELTFLPPESASEGSEIMEFGDAASGKSSNSISERAQTPPQNIDVIHSAHTRRDVNEVSFGMDVTLPSQRVDSPRSSVPIISSATAEVNIVPFSSPSLRFNNPFEPGGLQSSPASPTRKGSSGPMQYDGLSMQTSLPLTTNDLPPLHDPLSPQPSRRKSAARKTSVSSVENTPSKNERPLSGDMFARRKNNTFNSPSYKGGPLPSNKSPESPVCHLLIAYFPLLR